MQEIPFYNLTGYDAICESCRLLPVKTVMERALKNRFGIFGVVPRNSTSNRGELLEKTLTDCGWFYKTPLDGATSVVQMHAVNTVIFYANLLLKSAEGSLRFIPKTSDVKTRVAKVREGDKKISH
jgi:hypothetical protein